MTQQLDLFSCVPGGAVPSFPRDLSGMRWVDLDESAWVAWAPGLLSGHDALYQRLREELRWRSDRRIMYEREVDVPRLMARLPDDGPVPGVLAELRDALSRHFGRSLRRISANWYRSGDDSVAPHGDRMGPLVGDTVVAILSLGEPRPFVMRPKAGGAARRYLLGWGDLLVMGGDCQERWVHGVPKVKGGGGRISVMFREALPAQLAPAVVPASEPGDAG
jgi:alkylated DNA repair dioxygenase AlkB